MKGHTTVRTIYLAIATGIGLSAAATPAHAQANTLDNVKQRGSVNWGVEYIYCRQALCSCSKQHDIS